MPDNSEFRSTEDVLRDPGIHQIFACPICHETRVRTVGHLAGWVCSAAGEQHGKLMRDPHVLRLLDEHLGTLGTDGCDRNNVPHATKFAKKILKAMTRKYGLRAPPQKRGELAKYKRRAKPTGRKRKKKLPAPGLFDGEE